MALWSDKDLANNSVLYPPAGGYGVSSNGEVLYGNVTPSAFVTDSAIGTFGIDSTEMTITTGEAPYAQHSGWNLRKAGVGSVIKVEIANPGANYASNGFITFTGGYGSGANASYTVNTVSNTIVSVTLNSGGSNYVTTPTANAANGTSVDSASFIVTMGGRANRIQYETLVAMGSMTEDGDDDSILPDS